MPDEMAPPPDLRFAPLHYLEESFEILTWELAGARVVDPGVGDGRSFPIYTTTTPELRLPRTLEFDGSALCPDIWIFFGVNHAANCIVAYSGKGLIPGQGKVP